MKLVDTDEFMKQDIEPTDIAASVAGVIFPHAPKSRTMRPCPSGSSVSASSA
jgi:hypothetical protein